MVITEICKAIQAIFPNIIGYTLITSCIPMSSVFDKPTDPNSALPGSVVVAKSWHHIFTSTNPFNTVSKI